MRGLWAHCHKLNSVNKFVWAKTLTSCIAKFEMFETTRGACCKHHCEETPSTNILFTKLEGFEKPCRALPKVPYTEVCGNNTVVKPSFN